VPCGAVKSTVVLRRSEFGVGFLYGVYRQGNDFELIPAAK